ncbi:hypothetical protein [Stenotrophomonas maltophilia]|uniref:hypothetical protein n=1 Tax=Stenotrophomonas maltophilia TaxID=40324 RepID=UPI0015DF319F|nr:hypothetical protein [Stenotrophomonas maltophilia]MBA0239820.1 hypothetical protein [Stenotrophomonas maltophilia]
MRIPQYSELCSLAKPDNYNPEEKKLISNQLPKKRAVRSDKFKIPFELAEHQIGMKLEHYFGILEECLGGNFELESSTEAKTGADYEYKGLQARYYLQAKSPIALRSTQIVPIAKGKENEGLNAIRAFRKDNNLAESPHSFCFGLRKPAKHAKVPDELQHNLLYAMNSPDSNSHAMYVAPTVHSKEEYLALLRDRSHFNKLYDGPFWGFGEKRVSLANFASDVMMNMPFLQAHICITPHDKVTTHEHHYSYSAHANDVAFHSPIVLESASWSLADFLASQARQIAGFETQSTESVLNEMREALPESVLRALGDSSQQDQPPLSTIRKIGKMLWEQYGIVQYLVMKRRAE